LTESSAPLNEGWERGALEETGRCAAQINTQRSLRVQASFVKIKKKEPGKFRQGVSGGGTSNLQKRHEVRKQSGRWEKCGGNAEKEQQKDHRLTQFWEVAKPTRVVGPTELTVQGGPRKGGTRGIGNESKGSPCIRTEGLGVGNDSKANTHSGVGRHFRGALNREKF